MDLKALRDQAINEANDDFHEEKVSLFKRKIKNIIYAISQNNASIVALQQRNEELKVELESFELTEFDRVKL